MIKINFPQGATHFGPDEIQDLKPIHITTQTELNEWEQANILEAEDWVFSKHRPDILILI